MVTKKFEERVRVRERRGSNPTRAGAIKFLAVLYAGIAQSVEQLICNQQVGGSSPSTSSIYCINTIQ